MWICALQGKQYKPAPALAAPQQVGGDDLCLWEVPDDDEESEDDEQASFDRARRPAAGEDWTEFNLRQRGDSLTFAQSEPRTGLLITCIALQPQVCLMHKLLDRSSTNWQHRQATAAIDSNTMIMTRLADAYSCKLTTRFSTRLDCR